MAQIPLTMPSENARKIPLMVFIEKVEQFLVAHGAEAVMGTLKELYSKYNLMQSQLTRSKEVLKAKVPDITKALDMVKFLIENHSDFTVDFQLTENIWAKANVPQTDRVGLWLGANVMLEFPVEEAKVLLERNLVNAEASIESTDTDLKFIKDQITTCEVNIARVHNFIVTHRPRPS